MRNHRLTKKHQSTQPSIHTYIYACMNNNANSCMHTQHPTIAETHTHAHIHAYGKPNMHILADRHKHTAHTYSPIYSHTYIHGRTGIHHIYIQPYIPCMHTYTYTRTGTFTHNYIHTWRHNISGT